MGGRIACKSTISPHPATYGGEREGGKGAKSLKNWRVKKFQPNIIFQLKQRSSTLPWKVAIICHPATKSKQTQCLPPEHLMMTMAMKSMMTMIEMTSMMMMMTGRRREAVVSAVIWKLSLTPKYQGMLAQGAPVIHSHHCQTHRHSICTRLS